MFLISSLSHSPLHMLYCLHPVLVQHYVYIIYSEEGTPHILILQVTLSSHSLHTITCRSYSPKALHAPTPQHSQPYNFGDHQK